MKDGIEAPRHLVDSTPCTLRNRGSGGWTAVRLRLPMSDVAGAAGQSAGHTRCCVEALELSASRRSATWPHAWQPASAHRVAPYFRRDVVFRVTSVIRAARLRGAERRTRLHAIFGTADACIAVHPLLTWRSRSSRWTPSLHTAVRRRTGDSHRAALPSPGDCLNERPSSEHGELIIGVEIPATPFDRAASPLPRNSSTRARLVRVRAHFGRRVRGARRAASRRLLRSARVCAVASHTSPGGTRPPKRSLWTIPLTPESHCRGPRQQQFRTRNPPHPTQRSSAIGGACNCTCARIDWRTSSECGYRCVRWTAWMGG